MSGAGSIRAVPVRALVVDDEASIRRLLRIILTRLTGIPATVQEAASAEEGIAMLRAHAFDLVITDYRMAGATGVDLLEVAARERPEAKRVLITAFDEVEIGVQAINRGHVDGFVRKPWENERFVALVRGFFDGNATSDSAGPPPRASAGGASRTAAPPAARPAAAPATGIARARPRATVEAELAEVTRQMQQLRVRLGLGTLSAVGYEKMVAELGRKRGALEAELFRVA